MNAHRILPALALLALPCLAQRRATLEPGGLVVHRDLPYAEPSDPLTTLDLYLPAEQSAAPRPLAVYVHGGGWAIGDKRRVQKKPKLFVDAGYLFASINYRLSPAVQHPAHVEDVANAVAWLHDNAARYGGDPERMVLLGHSAGAHLVALVATDTRRLQGLEKEPDFLKGVILLDGAGYDIGETLRRARASAFGAVRVRMFETAFGEAEAGWRDASPITHVTQGNRYPPFLILHVAEREESRLQSTALARALREAGGEATLVPARGKSHRTINTELGEQGDVPTQAVRAFLKSLEPVKHQTPGTKRAPSPETPDRGSQREATTEYCERKRPASWRSA